MKLERATDMPGQIVISFEKPVDIHKMRNFGEALYHACKDDGWASITLQEVDRATKELRVIVRFARRVRRTSAIIEKLLDEHFLKDTARLTHVKRL